jgi:hypothetical protein
MIAVVMFIFASMEVQRTPCGEFVDSPYYDAHCPEMTYLTNLTVDFRATNDRNGTVSEGITHISEMYLVGKFDTEHVES